MTLNDTSTSKPDFERWAKRPYWTVKEAISLSLGLIPYRDIESDMRSQQENGEQRANEYMDRLVSCRRARTSGDFGPSPARLMPAVFLTWAKSMEFECPEELELAVAARGQATAKKPKTRESDETRKINKRNMVIAAWARSAGYDPLRHSEAIGKMQKTIQVNGGNIGHTALRKIVNEGWEDLD